MMLNRGERPALRAQPYHFRLTLTDDTLDILNTRTCFNAPPIPLGNSLGTTGAEHLFTGPREHAVFTTNHYNKPQEASANYLKPLPPNPFQNQQQNQTECLCGGCSKAVHGALCKSNGPGLHSDC
jgi:hypothetical protein